MGARLHIRAVAKCNTISGVCGNWSVRGIRRTYGTALCHSECPVTDYLLAERPVFNRPRRTALPFGHHTVALILLFVRNLTLIRPKKQRNRNK